MASGDSSSSLSTRHAPPVERLAFGLLSTIAAVVIAWLLQRGWSYYTTPLVERPRHPDYWLLKPGGSWGQVYGMVGATLLVLMLSYSVRRRIRALRGFGPPLRTWLSFHIFCGVTGATLVVLHTSFKFRGLVALAFWAMVIVALSGVIGRYLYRQIPRARSGDELSLEQAKAESVALAEALADLGVTDEDLARLEALGRRGPLDERRLLMLLLRLPVDDLRLRRRLRRFTRQIADVPPHLRRRVERLARRQARLTRRIALWQRVQQLFYYWHVLHKPVAVIMYIFVVVHVAVVTMAGYGLGIG